MTDALELVNVTTSLYKLDDDEKLLFKIWRAGQNREMSVVNESGLYNLIFSSYKPEAKAFRKWVTSEVLPSIRKTGKYINPAINERKKRINSEIQEMLYVIKSNLKHGEQRKIAEEIGVTEKSVTQVLRGDVRSGRILKICYDRAKHNYDTGENLYANPKLIIKKLS